MTEHHTFWTPGRACRVGQNSNLPFIVRKHLRRRAFCVQFRDFERADRPKIDTTRTMPFTVFGGVSRHQVSVDDTPRHAVVADRINLART